MWGHLVPLSPFIQCDSSGETDAGVDDNIEKCHRRLDDHTPLKPLELPGSFGREELLRPLSKVCPTCSRRHRGITKNNAASPTKKRARTSPLCKFCQSIQSVAKFIPRTDFWCFSNAEGKRLQLTISGRNVSQLVRICSSSGDIRKSNNQQKEDLQKVEVNDGDVVSLLWYNQQNSKEGMINASSTLEPLIKFRLARMNDGNAKLDVVEDFPDNQVVVSLLIEAETDTNENNDSRDMNNAKIEVEKTVCNNGKIGHTEKERKEEVMDHNSGSQNGNKRNKHCDGIDDSSSSDDEHLWNAGGFLKTGTKEEKVALGNYFRNVRAKYGDDRRDNTKQQKASNSGSLIHDSDKPLAASGDDPCIGSIMDNSSKEDEESESAPLTLPSRFLASYSKSFSFDSMEKSPSQPRKNSGDNCTKYAEQNNRTPQKSTRTDKRTYGDMESTNQDKEATKTPKKSNVTIPDAKTSAPISSLSYNQLVDLHEETTPANSPAKQSLRNTVLSLTLALTSNASSYDSIFLKDCNTEANTKSGTKANEQISPQHERQQWMPRLLQGTQIELQKKIYIDNE
mmetsp:Transcript_15943/g.34508  ORF Transcript_15943/g.34508 Transcript_15943/m.34508 type:complete len:566 (-) Transcript_15943:22-1719(-)